MRKLEDFLNAEVYDGVINDEKEKPSSYVCFPGAWYYKALSSKDMWLGMEAKVTLPKFNPDEERFDMLKEAIDKDEPIKRYKDTPSIYMGGSSDFETDIGLGWFRGLIDGEFTKEKIAFRPFYRYIYEENGKEVNRYIGPSIKETEFYFFPGDTVKMSVFCVNDNTLRLKIELLEETKIDKYIEIRKKLNKNYAYESLDFPAPGNGVRPSEYKRVNAIDQYGNEGRPVQMTKANVEECTWSDCYLFREIDGKIMKVPYDESRYIKMLCPNQNSFIVTNNGNKVVIKPSKE